MKGPDRILAVTLVVIVAVAVVATVVSASRPAQTFGPGTPESVVQQYLVAIFEGRNTDAARALDPEGGCDEVDLANQAQSEVPLSRVVLTGSRVTDGSAVVDVKVVLTPGDLPVGSSEYSEDHTYALRRVGGAWVLTGTPWPLFDCVKGG